jgi:hypothetical protein
MTTKLTLTVDAEVVQSAKKYAGKKGISVSRMVENYLKAATSIMNHEEKSISPRIKRMMGSLKGPKSGDYKKELSKALAKKYG